MLSELKKLQDTVNSMQTKSKDDVFREEMDRLKQELDRAKASRSSYHRATDRPAASGASSRPSADEDCSSPRRPRQRKEEMECWGCGELGHLKHECKSEKSKPGGGGKAFKCSMVGSISRTACTYVRASIGSSGVREWLLDSGADRSVVPFAWVKHMQWKKKETSLKAANDTLIPVVAELVVPLRLWGEKDSALALVKLLATEHVTGGILGADFMREYVTLWDVCKNEVTVEGHHISLSSRQETGKCCRLVAQRETLLPAHTECVVPAMLQYDSLTPSRKAFATEVHALKEGVCTARVVLPRGCSDLPMRMLNMTAQDYRVRKGQELTGVELVDVLEVPAETSEEEKSIQAMVDRVDVSVEEEHREALKELLQEFTEIFSFHEFDLGRATAFKHAIDTGDAAPIRQRLRPQPRVKQDEIDRQVESMLQHKVIEESNSPWASNVVVVTKKDGSARVCVDYRKLNSVTRKDAYPLPRISDCIDALGGMRYFSSFDLRAGYWQMELEDDETKDRTSFITRRGSFRFNVLAFGLTGAPASFMRLMDTVMKGLNFSILLCYLDDIVVFSEDEEVHLERLRMLFERLRSSSLKLKPSKCQLFQTSIEFLGFIVGADGIRTDPKKVETVRTWPRPVNVREVRSFVGLCSYYRKYVPDFARLCAPLHGMTRKHAVFQWEEKCEAGFQALKSALMQSPVLSMPADEGKYYLDTDASNESIAAVLQQEQNGEVKVIAYASRLLRGPEKNYCVTRKELLAVVFYAKAFRNYLLGREFVVRTDHSALRWLRSTPEPIGQQARWNEILEEFDFVIEHRAGVKHTNADALSRRPCRQCGHGSDESATGTVVGHVAATRVSVAPVAVPAESISTWSAEQLSAMQRDDEDLKEICRLFTEKGAEITWDDVAPHSHVARAYWAQRQQLSLKDGVLYRRWLCLGDLKEKWLIVAPRVMRQQLLNQAHSGLGGGHLGARRTLARLRCRYFWIGQSEDVKRLLGSCTQCSRYRRGMQPRQGLLHPTVVSEPFERIGIDITGPHPVSKNGFRYILTIIDLFTKYAVCIAMRNHEAVTVSEVLYTHWITKFGAPMQLLSDRGAEFESQLMADLCRLMGIEKLRSTSYEPRTCGCCERLHRTLNAMLAKAMSDGQLDWDRHLAAVTAAYNATPQESTKFSPYFLLFGSEMRTPLEIISGVNPADYEPRTVSVDEWVNRKLEILSQAHRLTRENLLKAAGRQKTWYDRRVKVKQFEPGQLVWVFNPRRYVGKSHKWTMMYYGPFRVEKVLSDVNLVVKRTPKSNPQVVHVDKVKLYQGDVPEVWRQAARTATEVEDAMVQPKRVVKPRGGQRRRRISLDDNSDAEQQVLQRPVRQKALPARLEDFVLSTVDAGEGTARCCDLCVCL